MSRKKYHFRNFLFNPSKTERSESTLKKRIVGMMGAMSIYQIVLLPLTA
jgi:hypothetical protein